MASGPGSPAASTPTCWRLGPIPDPFVGRCGTADAVGCQAGLGIRALTFTSDGNLPKQTESPSSAMAWTPLPTCNSNGHTVGHAGQHVPPLPLGRSRRARRKAKTNFASPSRRPCAMPPSISRPPHDRREQPHPRRALPAQSPKPLRLGLGSANPPDRHLARHPPRKLSTQPASTTSLCASSTTNGGVTYGQLSS